MKTIREAAREYVDSHFFSNKVWNQEVEDAFESGVEFAQRWISVEEELPERGQLVLIKNKTGDISTARYCGNLKSKFIIDYSEISNQNVTHWRPIELK